VKRYVEGRVLVIVGSNGGGDSAEWGTERNGILRDCYLILGTAGPGGDSTELGTERNCM